MRIALDVGHRGRPSNIRDRGVVRDGLEVHGVILTRIEETDLSTRYTLAADKEARRLGHDVLIMGDGEYSERWSRADAWGATVYAQCHVNAGGGDRGEVFHDYRSVRGRKLAEAVARELGQFYPWPSQAKPCRPDDDGTPRDEDYTEAWNCIRGVRAVALVLEPYFLDGPRASAFVADVELAGIALARGIHAAWHRA